MRLLISCQFLIHLKSLYEYFGHVYIFLFYFSYTFFAGSCSSAITPSSRVIIFPPYILTFLALSKLYLYVFEHVMSISSSSYSACSMVQSCCKTSGTIFAFSSCDHRAGSLGFQRKCTSALRFYLSLI